MICDCKGACKRKLMGKAIELMMGRIRRRRFGTLVYRDGDTIKDVPMDKPEADDIFYRRTADVVGVFDNRATTADLRDELGLS